MTTTEAKERTYTASLTIRSTLSKDSPVELIWNWDPPFSEVAAQFSGTANFPPAYSLMAHILNDALMPEVSLDVDNQEEEGEDPLIANTYPVGRAETKH